MSGLDAAVTETVRRMVVPEYERRVVEHEAYQRWLRRGGAIQMAMLRGGFGGD